MKNRQSNYIQSMVLFLLLLCSSGCTQNNGYIGDLFGTWYLQSISSPEHPIDDAKEYYLLFQGSVFCLKEVDVQAYTVINAYGSFEEQDGTLVLDFKEDGADLASRLGFNESPITLQLTISSSDMTLTDQDQTAWVHTKHG